MEMTNERQFWNILKGLLIVLVVLGHFGQTISNLIPTILGFVGHGVILFIYTFHMPLFMFVSGYLSKKSEKRRAVAFKDLFIPYLLYQIFVGVCILTLTHSGGVLKTLFIPQMGIWYLLSLFSLRMILPEISKVKHIMLLSVGLTMFMCLFDGMNNAFAIQKTLGFLVFFLAGYFVSKDRFLIICNIVPKKIAVLGLGIELVIVIFGAKFTDYNLWLSVLSRTATAQSFSEWYFAPISYAFVFVISCVTCFLVLNSIPEKNSFLENQGKDTMPMYISHLIVFMVIGFCVNKGNWMIAASISFIAMIMCLLLFSTALYRNLFNSVLKFINSFIFKKELRG